MTDQEVRELGLDQLTAGLARSAIVAQLVRQEALATLLTAVGEDPAAREAMIRACKRDSDARWWWLQQRRFGIARTIHGATVPGEEVNQERRVGQFPTT